MKIPSPQEAWENAQVLAEAMLRANYQPGLGVPEPGSAGWNETRTLAASVLLEIAEAQWSDPRFELDESAAVLPIRTDAGSRGAAQDLLRRTRERMVDDVLRQAVRAANESTDGNGRGA